MDSLELRRAENNLFDAEIHLRDTLDDCRAVMHQAAAATRLLRDRQNEYDAAIITALSVALAKAAPAKVHP